MTCTNPRHDPDPGRDAAMAAIARRPGGGAGRMTPCDCGVLHAAWAGDVIVDDPDDEIRAHRAVVHIERMSGHAVYIGKLAFPIDRVYI